MNGYNKLEFATPYSGKGDVENVCVCVCVWKMEREREREIIQSSLQSLCICMRESDEIGNNNYNISKYII